MGDLTDGVDDGCNLNGPSAHFEGVAPAFETVGLEVERMPGLPPCELRLDQLAIEPDPCDPSGGCQLDLHLPILARLVEVDLVTSSLARHIVGLPVDI